MTNVVMVSPGYPQEMSYFTRGLAAVGATVIGVGDHNTLYSYDLLQTTASPLSPLADGVFELHAVYGVDTTADGTDEVKQAKNIEQDNVFVPTRGTARYREHHKGSIGIRHLSDLLAA